MRRRVRERPRVLTPSHALSPPWNDNPALVPLRVPTDKAPRPKDWADRPDYTCPPVPPPAPEPAAEAQVPASPPPAPPAPVPRAGRGNRPSRPWITALAWAMLGGTLLLVGVVVAREITDNKIKLASAEAEGVVVQPVWVSDDVFQWNGIEWNPVYGGCTTGCTSINAVVAKTQSCWRMATEDGSLYLGQRVYNNVYNNVPSNVSLVRPFADRRGHAVVTAGYEPVAALPAVQWKVLPGAWTDSVTFVDSSDRPWRLTFEGTAENFASHPKYLPVVEVRTGGGLRLITQGGSMLVGPVKGVNAPGGTSGNPVKPAVGTPDRPPPIEPKDKKETAPSKDKPPPVDEEKPKG